MATGIFSVKLKHLKQQADEFSLEGKDRTKFLKEEWWKLLDAKLEKERFEREAEERRLGKRSIAKAIRNGRKTIGKRERNGRKTIGEGC